MIIKPWLTFLGFATSWYHISLYCDPTFRFSSCFWNLLEQLLWLVCSSGKQAWLWTNTSPSWPHSRRGWRTQGLSCTPASPSAPNTSGRASLGSWRYLTIISPWTSMTSRTLLRWTTGPGGKCSALCLIKMLFVTNHFLATLLGDQKLESLVLSPSSIKALVQEQKTTNQNFKKLS